MPLSHAPGHAQCDFGEALMVIGGDERKMHYFVLDLPHSDGCFVKAYPAETSEAFLDGHASAFAFLSGVPHDRRQFVLPCIASNQMLLNFGRTRSPGGSSREMGDNSPAPLGRSAATHRRTRFGYPSFRRPLPC